MEKNLLEVLEEKPDGLEVFIFIILPQILFLLYTNILVGIYLKNHILTAFIDIILP